MIMMTKVIDQYLKSYKINGQLLHLHDVCSTYHSKNLYPTARASLTHSSAVRCGPLSEGATDDADAGMNPTLYVPNPL